MLCSYNKGVLNFLDHLCSFYEQNYGPFPIEAESTQINKFMDKVYELADENGLSSNAYKSMLEEFAAGEIRGYLNEVLYSCIGDSHHRVFFYHCIY